MQQSRRRPPGGAKGKVTLYAKIDPHAAGVVDEVAHRVGLSKAEFVEELAIQLERTLDDRGLPLWWTRPLPNGGDFLLDEERRRDVS